MRSTLAVAACVLFLVSTGCTRFNGEWLEEGIVFPDGRFRAADTERRTAARFDWPATLRLGSYADTAKCVDYQSVEWEDYWTVNGDEVAQSGSMAAHIDPNDKNRMLMVVGNDVIRRFVKVKGKSIFPPSVRWPSLATGNS